MDYSKKNALLNKAFIQMKFFYFKVMLSIIFIKNWKILTLSFLIFAQDMWVEENQNP